MVRSVQWKNPHWAAVEATTRTIMTYGNSDRGEDMFMIPILPQGTATASSQGFVERLAGGPS